MYIFVQLFYINFIAYVIIIS